MPVILMVKSSVASAHPRGSSDRQDDTAATSPATPTIDAGNCPGGPENRSSNGNSIVTAPGEAATTLMAYSRINPSAARKDSISVRSSCCDVSSMA